jgi:ABC-2 type transport system permease protein
VTNPISATRATWLLTRLRLRRQLNQIGSLYRFRKASPTRTATARKSSSGWLLTAFVILAMLGNFTNLAHQTMANMVKVLGSVQESQEIRRGWLGVQIGPVTAEIADRLGLKPARGALITGIIDGGPAKPAGLQSGDVIVRFDGKDIKETGDLPGIVGATPVGKTVQMVIVHDGREARKILKVGLLPGQGTQVLVRRFAPAPGSVLPPGVMKGAILGATLLLLAALFITLASREITRPEWDLEWLVTLPLPLSTLLSSRLVERAVTNSAGFVALGPFLSILAWECGYRWTAPLIGFGLTFALLFAVATFQTLVDTGLRMSLPPPKLRNLQAVISVVSVLPLMLAMSMGIRDNVFVFGWAAALPDWTSWLPTGLAVRALASADGGSAALWTAAMVGEIIAVVAIGYALLQRQLRNGVVAVGAREAVARVPRAARRQATDLKSTRALLSPVQRRELRLLGRDRTFMAQTLLLPAIVVGAQVFINARANVFVGAVAHPENLAAIAFGLAAYTLMLSAFQTLNAEGQALWILYCVPHSLESVLRQKAKLWATAATIYPLLIFAVAVAVAGTVSLQFIGSAAIVLLGVPIFAVIATALGVFGCDPLAQEVQRRVRPTYVYLYMTLASLYVYAVYASNIWQRGAMMILTTLLAIALWQRARDRLDYLLDPSASPPARVSVSDGMIAALVFFVLQALVVIIVQSSGSNVAPTTMVWIAFCAAGAVTYTVMRLFYWRAHTAGVPRIVNDGVPRALLWGAAGGVIAAIAGLAYINIAASMDLLPHANPPADRSAAIGLAALAIAAAPLFEEFIFRGLIFGGLRRSLGLGAATLASAAIFAIVHPPMSVIPVFVMGVCAAVVYERTKMLAAPMLVHAIYNAAVLVFQWNVMQ